MTGFFKKVFEMGTWSEFTYRDRANLPPRAFINPRDFRGNESIIIAFAAPERPRFGPPIWQNGVVEYISEAEAEKIFEYHYRELRAAHWRKFALEHEKRFAFARRQRIYHRKIPRNKRAFNYWSGYVMGMKVAFQISHGLFSWKPKSLLGK